MRILTSCSASRKLRSRYQQVRPFQLTYSFTFLLALVTCVCLHNPLFSINPSAFYFAQGALVAEGQTRSFSKNPRRSQYSIPQSVLDTARKGPSEFSSLKASAFNAKENPQNNIFYTNNRADSYNSSDDLQLKAGSGQGWQAWIGLPSPRIGGQALQVDHYLFILGGTTNPVTVPVKSRGKSASQAQDEDSTVKSKSFAEALIDEISYVDAFTGKPAHGPFQPSIADSVDIMLFIDLLVLFKFLPTFFSGDPVLPFSSKAGIAIVGYDLFISYACDVSSNGQPSGTFIRISMPAGALWSLEDTPPPSMPVRMLDPSIERFGASMGQYVYYQQSVPPAGDMNVIDALPIVVSELFIFGGRDAEMKPLNIVETFTNDSWTTLNVTFPKPYCFCSVSQGVYGSQGEDALFLTDCHDCLTWESVNDSVVFLTDTLEFVFANDTHDIEPALQWPANNGVTSNNLMGTMLPGITYSPSSIYPLDPLALLLYDTTNQRMIDFSKYRPMDMQEPRTACAVFSVSGYLMCIGGMKLNHSATSVGDSVQMLPNVYAMPDHSDGVYEVGETPNVITSGSCGANTMLMLATDPNCQVTIPYTSMFKCNNPETEIPISTLTVDVDQELEMYVCATDGTCFVEVGERQACQTSGSNLDQYTCLWSRCCWDASAPPTSATKCFQPGPATLANQLTTSWMQTTLISSSQTYNPRPIVLTKSAPANANKTTGIPLWLIISLGVVGALLLYLLGALLWRYRKQRIAAKKRQMYSTNAFFAAFGKAYQVQGLIGQGSYGAVFLAERARDKKLVALKIIPCVDYKQRDMALKEFDVLNRLNHPHLIPVVDLIINWDSKEVGGPNDTISRKSRLTFDNGLPQSAAASELATSPSSPNTKEHNSKKSQGSDEKSLFGGNSGANSTRYGATTSGANSSNGTSLLKKESKLPSSLDREPLLNGGNGLINSGFNKGSDLVDMIPNSSRLPSRFICIATEFFPEGDLTRFVLSYPRRGAILLGDNDPLECVMHYEQVEKGAILGLDREGKSRRETLALPIQEAGNSSSNYTRVPAPGTSSVVISNGSQGNTRTRLLSSSGGAEVHNNVNIAYAALSNSEPTVKPIPEDIIRKYCLQIAEVMAYMHNLDPPLVHRDLKPDNVLVDKDRVVVTDFGLSSWQTNEATGVGADTCVGTLFFAAPEALGGPSDGLTPAVDCWALGCILYAMCTRRVLPETARVMFSDVDDEDFEEQIRGDLELGGYSKAMGDIIMALLRREPHDRMTALQAMAALKNNT